jgi:hypothetical protein
MMIVIWDIGAWIGEEGLFDAISSVGTTRVVQKHGAVLRR